jgi:hypothetical protein
VNNWERAAIAIKGILRNSKPISPCISLGWKNALMTAAVSGMRDEIRGLNERIDKFIVGVF